VKEDAHGVGSTGEGREAVDRAGEAKASSSVNMGVLDSSAKG
jgi:hypothetical protein